MEVLYTEESTANETSGSEEAALCGPAVCLLCKDKQTEYPGPLVGGPGYSVCLSPLTTAKLLESHLTLRPFGLPRFRVFQKLASYREEAKHANNRVALFRDPSSGVFDVLITSPSRVKLIK